MTNLPSEISQMYNEEYYRNWNAPALKVEAIRLHKELAMVMQENKDAITRIEKEARDEAFTAMDQGATCCKDKHQTFYGAIIKSPQWQAWYKEQTKRFGELKLNKKTNKYEGEPTFDIDESVGIGAIGDRHLQEFFRFIEKEAYERGFKEGAAQTFGTVTDITSKPNGFSFSGNELFFREMTPEGWSYYPALTKERKDK